MHSVGLIQRGDIWIVAFDPVRGHEQGRSRPSVILTSDTMDTSVLKLVQVLPGTSTQRTDSRGRPVPNHVRVDPAANNGLTVPTFFMCEQIRTVALERLGNRLGRVSEPQMEMIEEVLKLILDL